MGFYVLYVHHMGVLLVKRSPPFVQFDTQWNTKLYKEQAQITFLELFTVPPANRPNNNFENCLNGVFGQVFAL